MIRPEPAAAWALKPFGGLGALLAGNAVNGGAVAYVREPATVIFKKGDPVGKPAVPAKASSMITAALILCNVLLIATKPTDAPRRWIIQRYHRSFMGAYRFGNDSHRFSVDAHGQSSAGDEESSAGDEESGVGHQFTVHSHRSPV